MEHLYCSFLCFFYSNSSIFSKIIRSFKQCQSNLMNALETTECSWFLGFLQCLVIVIFFAFLPSSMFVTQPSSFAHVLICRRANSLHLFGSWRPIPMSDWLLLKSQTWDLCPEPPNQPSLSFSLPSKPGKERHSSSRGGFYLSFGEASTGNFEQWH